jgi:deazaflavin-dependent oxidoreductase (nitroreductase family)
MGAAPYGIQDKSVAITGGGAGLAIGCYAHMNGCRTSSPASLASLSELRRQELAGGEQPSQTTQRGVAGAPLAFDAVGQTWYETTEATMGMLTTTVDPAERRLELRIFYKGWRPTRLGKYLNRVSAWLSGVGLTLPILLALQVRGRESGRLRTNVLVPAPYDDQRYLVSMLGDSSDWVRNVRAAGGAAFIKRGRSRPVKLTEIPPEERAPILKAYCVVATSGRYHFPVPPTAPLAEFEAIAAHYPVFRIDPATR